MAKKSVEKDTRTTIPIRPQLLEGMQPTDLERNRRSSSIADATSTDAASANHKADCIGAGTDIAIRACSIGSATVQVTPECIKRKRWCSTQITGVSDGAVTSTATTTATAATAAATSTYKTAAAATAAAVAAAAPSPPAGALGDATMLHNNASAWYMAEEPSDVELFDVDTGLDADLALQLLTAIPES
jgi:hypothetical protein